MAVAPGKSVAVVNPKLVHKINEETQEVYGGPSETAKSADYFSSYRVVIGEKRLVRNRSWSLSRSLLRVG